MVGGAPVAISIGPYGLEKGKLPSRSRIIQQNSKSIGKLPDLLHEVITPRLILQVCNNNMALPRTKLVQPSGRLLELRLLSAGNDDGGSVLDEALSGHLPEAGCAACDEGDMVFEVEDVGDGEVRTGGIHFDGRVDLESVVGNVLTEMLRVDVLLFVPRFEWSSRGSAYVRCRGRCGLFSRP